MMIKTHSSQNLSKIKKKEKEKKNKIKGKKKNYVKSSCMVFPAFRIPIHLYIQKSYALLTSRFPFKDHIWRCDWFS